jgi:hypothetical protein
MLPSTRVVRRIQPPVVAIVTAAAALALLATFPREVFWGPDCGNHFIQLQQFLRSPSLAIDDPSRHVEPTGRLAPTAGHHLLRKGDLLYSFYSPWFPLLSVPFYRLLGAAGLFVIPIAATIALIVLFGSLYRAMFGDEFAGLAAAALVAASPLFFYTIVFWEHTLAVALSTAGILLLLRRKPAVAGALVGLSVLFREEGYVALASIGIALLASRETRALFVRFAAGAVVVIAPLWVVNFTLYAHPFGLHALIYADMHSGVRELAANFDVYLLRYTSEGAVQITIAAPFLALLLLGPLRRSSKVDAARTILLYATAAASWFAVIRLFTSADPMRETLFTQALFGALPWLAAVLAAPRTLPRFLGVTMAVALIATVLLLHQRDIGVIWGPRHFLWLIPVLVLAARAALSNVPKGAIPAVVLLATSAVAIHVFGVTLLSRKLSFSHSLLQALRSGGAQVIATDVFWIPEDLAALWFEKELVVVASDDDLAFLLRRLRSRGVKRLDFVASRPPYRHISNRGLAPLLRHTTSHQRIGGSETLLDAMIVRVVLE